MDPPLSIPNREVKRTYADGTDRPVGRVGSRRSSDPRTKQFARGSFFCARRPGAAAYSPRLFPSAPGKGQVHAAREMASRYLHSPSARPSPAAAPPSQRRGYLLSQLVGGGCSSAARGGRRFCRAAKSLTHSHFLEIKSAKFTDFISGISLTHSDLAARSFSSRNRRPSPFWPAALHAVLV